MASWRGVPTLGFALAATAYGVALLFDIPTLRLLAKPLPAVALALWTFGVPGAGLVTAGLAFSALGDLALELGVESAFFLVGMAAFAVTHVLYVIAFFARSRQPRPLALLVFLTWSALLLRLLWAGLGPLAAPVTAYAMLLAAMMWRATAAAFETGRWDVMIGAVLFGVSDSLIAVDRFHGPVPAARWLIMASYWAGQFGIARWSLRDGARSRGAGPDGRRAAAGARSECGSRDPRRRSPRPRDAC